MSKGASDKITCKPYDQGQARLVPPSADEIIPEKRLARPVGEVTDGLGMERLLRKYQAGGGASRYHPGMTAKLFARGYMAKACSSRMPAKAARESVMFMWLAGGRRPDFRAPSDFRGRLGKGVTKGGEKN